MRFSLDREEATKEGDFTLNEDDDEDDEQEEWEGDAAAWTNDADEAEGDVKDESAAYLEFLSEEVSHLYSFDTFDLLRIPLGPKIRRR